MIGAIAAGSASGYVYGPWIAALGAVVGGGIGVTASFTAVWLERAGADPRRFFGRHAFVNYAVWLITHLAASGIAFSAPIIFARGLG